MYIEKNLYQQVIEGLLQPRITLENLETHPVTKLYEVCQRMGWSVELVVAGKTAERKILVERD